MSQFWENAHKLLETALHGASSGAPAGDGLTVLIGAEGGIHILAHNDWPLDRLAAERGARQAYRVHQSRGRLIVDGVGDGNSCHLETKHPGTAAKTLLRDQPVYRME